ARLLGPVDRARRCLRQSDARARVRVAAPGAAPQRADRPRRMGHDAADHQRLLQPDVQRSGVPGGHPAAALLRSRRRPRGQLRRHRRGDLPRDGARLRRSGREVRRPRRAARVVAAGGYGSLQEARRPAGGTVRRVRRAARTERQRPPDARREHRRPGGPLGRLRRLPPLAERRGAAGARRPDGRPEVLPLVRADLAFALPRAAAALAGAEQSAQPAEIPRQRRGAQRRRLVFRLRRAARRQALPARGRARTDLVKSGLPVDEALGPLGAALGARGAAVLEAPPGAGKSTVVPLALLGEDWAAGKRLIMLEPRRLAARACAERMAQSLGESVGRTVGYRMRFDSRVSSATRIEVVTEGVLTRLLQGDPALEGVAALIFDEFHERSLQADLGLALSLDAREHLAPELRLLVMSATLDGAAVASLLGDAPRVSAPGRSMRPNDSWHSSSSGHCARSAATCWRSCRARARSGACTPRLPPHSCPQAFRSCRYSEISRASSRMPRSPPRPPVRAKWCSRPTSPKPVSPSRACAWSSTRDSRVARASIRYPA